MGILGELDSASNCHTINSRVTDGVGSCIQVSGLVVDERRGELLVGAPPAGSINTIGSHTPGISGLGVSMGEVRVRALVLGEETTVVVVAILVGVTSVVLGLVIVRSVTMSINMRLDVSLLNGLLVGIVVLAVDVLSLGAVGVLGLAAVAAVVRGISNACDEGKCNGERVHYSF